MLATRTTTSNTEKHFLLKAKDGHSSKTITELICYIASILETIYRLVLPKNNLVTKNEIQPRQNQITKNSEHQTGVSSIR